MRPPATRDQADAYRFGLRRLEAALVRGDPVPLHEQIRAQRRATLAGVLLGLLGLCGVAVYALMVPRPDWRDQAVVVGSGSGALYVVAHRPDRLVPVANLPAARLVLAALRRSGAADVDPGTAAATPVPDDALAAAPRTPMGAVDGAWAVDLGATVLPPRWAVCDEVDPSGRIVGTTVVGGAALLPPSPPADGVLLTGPDGAQWLVTAGRRHRIDLGDSRLLAAYGLVGAVPRSASSALLGVLPEGPVLAPPAVPGRGGPAPDGLPGRIGDVLAAGPVGGSRQYFVVLGGGLQPVPELVGRLLRVTSQARAIHPVPLEVVAAAAVVEDLPVAGWPISAPRLWDAQQAPTLCWTWTADGPPGGAVWWGSTPPVPAGTVGVGLVQADGPGSRVDAVAVGAGAAVRAAARGSGSGAGSLWLVSATGVAYRVVDDATAAALGITAAESAPEAVLRLLPSGRPLDVSEAGRVLDLPSPPG